MMKRIVLKRRQLQISLVEEDFDSKTKMETRNQMKVAPRKLSASFVESFQEDWVQCCSCGGWAHVACADSDYIAHFVCEHCK